MVCGKIRLTPWLMNASSFGCINALAKVKCVAAGGKHALLVDGAGAHCNTLQDTATHCNALQHTVTHCDTLQHAATRCNTLQHAATRCNTLQHTVINKWKMLAHLQTHANAQTATATRCNTLQHTATRCNTLQHTATCALDAAVVSTRYSLMALASAPQDKCIHTYAPHTHSLPCIHTPSHAHIPP